MGHTEKPLPLPAGLLDTTQVTAILNISARTLWSLVASGEIPVVRIRRRRLFDPADVRAYIEAAKSGGKGGRK
ncbi:MAG: helix-turn-helix domain-containing protein [Tepidisphaera sp.]